MMFERITLQGRLGNEHASQIATAGIVNATDPFKLHEGSVNSSVMMAKSKLDRNTDSSGYEESSKDCLVYETYLEAAKELRAAGLTTSIVFLSSNTNEYLRERRIVKPEISVEFSPLATTYSPNMAAAKNELGF